MSVPPPAPPPGGYYPAPPPSTSNSSGCWKAAGIGCGVALLLAVVLVFFAGRAIKQQMEHHTGLFGQAMNLGTAIGNGIKIQRGVVQYHKAHGRYPARLTDLVADGEIDGKILHSPIDPDPNPGHVSWTYTKPAEGAPGDTKILSMHYRITLPGSQNRQQTQDSDIGINLDGTTSSGSTFHTNAHTGGTQDGQ